MKKGDTVLVKAEIAELKDKDGNEVAKDTEITFEVAEDKDYTFYEVKFEKNPDAVENHSRDITFKAEKGKTYSIKTVTNDGAAPTIQMSYDDGKKYEDIADIPQEKTKDNDVNIMFKVTLSKEASTDFYIFIKDTTPKAE